MSKLAKKVFSSVSEALATKLEKRAEEEGRSLSNLVGYLLERAMETWEPEKKEQAKK